MKLLIFGASTRAAAYSALRAGLRPECADFFADRDLNAVCSATRIPFNGPIGETIVAFVDLAKRKPPSRWIYTGPFENYPGPVDEIGLEHRLWGNSCATLRKVRDPFRLADCLRGAGLSCPEVRPDPQGLPVDGSWLAKPLASGGGLGISPLTSKFDPGTGCFYFQQRRSGRSYSALFLGTNGRASFIGVSRQLLGMAGHPFTYRGNIGPLKVSPGLQNELHAIGNTLASEFGLVGLFGADFILNEGRAWIVEVNPRYTGAVEIFELATGASLLLEHRRVCDSEFSEQDGQIGRGARYPTPHVVGKWILYATRPLIFPELPIGMPTDQDLYAIPEVADIPNAGLFINQGDPVMTVFGAGSDPKKCMMSLRSNVNRWRRRLEFVS